MSLVIFALLFVFVSGNPLIDGNRNVTASEPLSVLQNNTKANLTAILLRGGAPAAAAATPAPKGDSTSNKESGLLSNAAGKVVGSAVNKTMKSVLSNLAGKAFGYLIKGKALYSLLPPQIRKLLEGWLSKFVDEGFAEVNRIIDRKESSIVAQPIEFVNQILIPLIELMSSVKDQSAFDCW